jgi:hypothetical protein
MRSVRRGRVMLDRIFNMLQSLTDNELVFWYNGPVSQVLVGEIGDIIKKCIENESDKKVINRIFSILVEQMQNIIKYSEKTTAVGYGDDRFLLRSGLVAVALEDDSYSVASGNVVFDKDILHIRERLDLIISMDKDAQKEYYKTMRKKEPDERSLGAGLGFIEMARKSSAPLEYKFTPIDDGRSFFALKASVRMDL